MNHQLPEEAKPADKAETDPFMCAYNPQPLRSERSPRYSWEQGQEDGAPSNDAAQAAYGN